MLEVTNLRRTYDDFVAVDRVNFSIGQGEIVGLLGHNGAGKTTIMKMLTGYLEPSAGTILMDGVDLEQEPQQIQQQLGYLPENLPIYSELSVADYLEYAANMKGIPITKQDIEIKRVIQQTNLESKILSPIAALSRGYKQRVGVAQAILGRPKLLILDEPTNGLDPSQTQQMRELIRTLSEHATIILSTHIMQEVDAICDRVLILNRGELVLDSTLQALREEDHLLLTTSVAENEILPLLKEIEDVDSIEPASGQTDHHLYRIRTLKGASLESLCDQIAVKMVGAGHPIFALTPEHRDLETVFREVSNEQIRQEKLHAA